MLKSIAQNPADPIFAKWRPTLAESEAEGFKSRHVGCAPACAKLTEKNGVRKGHYGC
jgi:hypothetical protein